MTVICRLVPLRRTRNCGAPSPGRRSRAGPACRTMASTSLYVASTGSASSPNRPAAHSIHRPNWYSSAASRCSVGGGMAVPSDRRPAWRAKVSRACPTCEAGQARCRRCMESWMLMLVVCAFLVTGHAAARRRATVVAMQRRPISRRARALPPAIMTDSGNAAAPGVYSGRRPPRLARFR
jgi:hypothetical protein